MVKVCPMCELELANELEKCPVCGGDLRKRTVGDVILSLFDRPDKSEEPR